MILYNKDNNILKIERELIENNIKIQKNTKKLILNYMQNFADSVNNFYDTSTNSFLTLLKNLKHCSELCTENISYLGKCANTIDNIEFSISYNSHDLDNMLETFNVEYSELNKTVAENTVKIQECLYSVSENVALSPIIKNVSTLYNEEGDVINQEHDLEESMSVSNNTISKSEVLSEVEPVKTDDDFSIPKVKNPTFVQEFDFIIPRKIEYLENTLVVSDSTQSVTLPYSICSLNQTLKNNSDKYSCIDDIIFESYTLPLEMFKNPFTSRFKEAFKLIRKKEHGSIFDAFELGLELMFNYKLHPAIIAACKNLEELDIYLDYLSEGKTNEFKCFNVKFDLPPAVIK